MAEAMDQGFDIRWNCSKEEGARLYKIYQKRFPIIDSEEVKARILERANEDIANMASCMTPLEHEMVLYRNIRTRFIDKLDANQTVNYLGFSSCSLSPHVAENATYGSSGCTLTEITVPAGTPAIRLDLMPDVQNEPDEVILPPITFLVTKVDWENNKVYMTCYNASN